MLMLPYRDLKRKTPAGMVWRTRRFNHPWAGCNLQIAWKPVSRYATEKLMSGGPIGEMIASR